MFMAFNLYLSSATQTIFHSENRAMSTMAGVRLPERFFCICFFHIPVTTTDPCPPLLTLETKCQPSVEDHEVLPCQLNSRLHGKDPNLSGAYNITKVTLKGYFMSIPPPHPPIFSTSFAIFVSIKIVWCEIIYAFK